MAGYQFSFSERKLFGDKGYQDEKILVNTNGKLEWLGPDEWIDKFSTLSEHKKYPDFYEERRKILEANTNNILQIPSGQRSKFSEHMGYIDISGNHSSMMQVINAQKQWEKANKIYSGEMDGFIFGIDTETIGDINNPKNHDITAGITEIGIGRQEFKNGKMIDEYYSSIVLGISDKQKAELLEQLNVLKEEGWDALGNGTKNWTPAQVTMERLSMYGGKPEEIFAKSKIKIFGDKEYFVVSKNGLLKPNALDTEAIRKGIESLNYIYHNSDPKETLSYVIPYILGIHKPYTVGQKEVDNRILAGANGIYDFDALINEARKFGVSFNYDDFRHAKKEYLDIINAMRFNAAYDNKSSQSYNKTLYGAGYNAKKYPASVESILDILRYEAEQTHTGGKDVQNELNIASTKNFENNTSFTEATLRRMKQIKERPELIHNYDDDTYFLFNRGVLDKNSMDVVRTVSEDGTASLTQKRPISNSYWKLDIDLDDAHTGYTTNNDGESRYILGFYDPLNPDRRLYKEYQTEEEAWKSLRENSTIARHVTYDEMHTADEIRHMDYGRRMFENTLDPANVSINSKKINGQSVNIDTGGFAQMKDYIKLHDIISSIDADDDTMERIKRISIQDYYDVDTRIYDNDIEWIKKIATENNIEGVKSEYQAQAFVGMYYRLENEKEYIKTVMNQVDMNMPSDSTNLMKTIVFRDAYNAGKNSLEKDASKRYVNATFTNAVKYTDTDEYKRLVIDNISLQDVYAIDFSINEKTYRINASSESSTVSSINKIINAVGRKNFGEAIGNMERMGKLPIPKDAIDALEVIRNAPKYKQYSNYDVASDIAHIFYRPFEEFNGMLYQAELDGKKISPVSLFKKILESEETTPLSDFLQNKNLYYLYDNLYDKTIAEYIIDGEEYTLDEMIKTFSKQGSKLLEIMKDSINESINGSVDKMPMIQVVTKDSYQEIINKLSDALNLYDDNGRHVLATTTDDEGNVISNLLNEIFDAHTVNEKGEIEYKEYVINKYKDAGLSSFVVEAKNGDAYIVMTNKEHVNKTVDLISNATDEDFKTLNTVKEYFKNDATVERLPQLKRTKIGEIDDLVKPVNGKKASSSLSGIFGSESAYITSVRQGESYERFLIPTLTQYRGKDDALRAYLNPGAQELYATHRLVGKNVINLTLEGNFEEASNIISRRQNAILQSLAAPSSYRGVRIPVIEGKKVRYETKRMASYHGSDFMQALEINLGELKEIYREVAKKGTPGEYTFNPLQELLFIINEQHNVVNREWFLDEDLGNIERAIDQVIDSSYFNEIFYRNLYSNGVADDYTIRNYLDAHTDGILDIDEVIDREVIFNEDRYYKLTKAGIDANRNVTTEKKPLTFLEMMIEQVSADTLEEKKIFHDSLLDSLTKIQEATPFLSQIVTQTGINKGIVTFMMPGALNDLGGLFSTLRPTYVQQNRYMSFSEDEVRGFLKNTPKDMTFIKFGAPAISNTEFIIRDMFNKTGYKTPAGKDYNSLEHVITTTVKQMNDADIYDKFSYISENSDEIAKKYKLNVDKFKAAVEYMKGDMHSTYEGKMYLPPWARKTDFVQMSDGFKMKLGTDSYNKMETNIILRNILHKDHGLVKNGDIIGVLEGSSKTPIFYEGPNVIIDNTTIKELLENGESYVIPSEPMIEDIKLMLDGSEKYTTHMANPEIFMKEYNLMVAEHNAKLSPDDVSGMLTEIKDVKHAEKILSAVYKEIGDGANAIANTKLFSHHNDPRSASDWYTIVMNYEKAGLLDEFTTSLNNLGRINGSNTEGYFSTWKPTVKTIGNKKLLVTDTLSTPESLGYTIDRLVDAVKNGTFGNDQNPDVFKKFQEVNTKIKKQLDWMKENDIIIGQLERMHMNEIMSNRAKLDQRIEQSFRIGDNSKNQFISLEKAKELFGEDVEYLNGIVDGYNGIIKSFKDKDGNIVKRAIPYADAYIDAYRDSVRKGEVTGTYIFGNYGNEFPNDERIDIINAAKHYANMENGSAIRANIASVRDEDTIRGIKELSEFISSKESAEIIKQRGIPVFNIDDILKHDIEIPESANVSLEQLEKFIFKIDGRPSKSLSYIADREGVGLANTYNIAFKLGREVNIHIPNRGYNKKPIERTIDTILLPIQNVRTKGEGEEYILEQGKIILRFLNKYKKLVTNPGTENIGELAEQIVNDYYNTIMEHLAVMNKDSDAFKIAGRTYLPYSGQFLAQDIASPLTEGLAERTKDIRAKIKNLGRQIEEIDGKTDISSLIIEYDKANEELDRILLEEGRKIRTADTLPELVSAEMIGGKNATAKVMVDGKEYYDLRVGVNKRTLEEKFHVNFGEMSMEIFDSYTNSGTPSFYKQVAIPGLKESIEANGEWVTDDVVKNLAKNLNAIQEGKHFEFNFDIDNVTADEIMKEVNNKIAGGINIKDVNEQIKHRRMKKVYEAFDATGLADRYMKEIGVIGNAWRFPLFQSQGIPMVVLDNKVGNGQIRYYNPVLARWQNADLDGDTSFGALLLDGGSMAKTMDERYVYAMEARKNVLRQTREQMALLVEEGAALKSQDIYSAAIRADQLEFFYDEKYNKAVQSWIENNSDMISQFISKNNLDISADDIVTAGQLKDISPGLYLKAVTSQEMKSAYRTSGFNLLTNKVAQSATTAVALRKNLIGNVSTPSYRLRNVARMLAVADGGNDFEKFTGFMYQLANMDTENRGFTGIVEQKSIDVKHIIDAFKVSEVPEYTSGLKKIFADVSNIQNADKKARKVRAKFENGLRDLIHATNAFTFKYDSSDKELYDAKVNSIISEILDTSYEELTGRISEIDEKISKAIDDKLSISEINALKKEHNIATWETYLKAIVGIAEDDRASALYNSDLWYMRGNGVSMDTLNQLAKFTKTMSEADKMEYYGSTLWPFIDILSNAKSQDRSIIQKNKLYIMPGSAAATASHKHNYIDRNLTYGIVLNHFDSKTGTPSFDIINLNKALKIDDSGKAVIDLSNITPDFTDYSFFNRHSTVTSSNNHLSNILFKDDSGMIKAYDYRSFLENPDIAAEVVNDSIAARIEKSLNDIVLTKSGNLRNEVNAAFDKNLPHMMFKKIDETIGFINEFGPEDVINDISDLFQTTGLKYNIGEKFRQSKYEQAINIMDDIKDSAELFLYAKNSKWKRVESNDQRINNINDVESLTRYINREIAMHPEKYKRKQGMYDGDNDKYFDTYEALYRQITEEVMGKMGYPVEKIRAHKEVFKDIDITKFDNIIESINNEYVDVQSSKNGVENVFNTIQRQIDNGMFKSDNELSKSLRELVKPEVSKTAMSSLIDSIEKNNRAIIENAEKEIYSLFNGNPELMSAFFQWNKPTSSTMVGFGEFIGVNFGELNNATIENIKKAGKIAENELQSVKGKEFELFAVRKTLNALDNFNTSEARGTFASRPNALQSTEVEDFINTTNAMIKEALRLEEAEKEAERQASRSASAKTAQKGAERAANAAENTIKRKTLSGSMIDKAKNIKDIPGKTVGSVIGAMMAIGLANNLLHNIGRKSHSPLSPHNNDNKTEPAYDDSMIAPSSMKRTIYADKNSGLEFTVKAKTKHVINQTQNANLIRMGGGGNASVYSSNDKSGVTDNWLENKFAELM